MEKKIFLLGLGCQKAGTTWLYSLISKSKNTNMGFLKEYHVLDAASIKELKYFKVRIVDFLRSHELFQIRKMQKNLDIYVSYFSGLLMKDEVRVSGDLTPSYSTLKYDTIHKVIDKFSKNKIKTKSIILIREPMSRALSSYKMNIHRGNCTEIPSKFLTENGFVDYFLSTQCELRGQYEKTIEVAKSAFNNNDLLVIFYEELFFPDTIKQISSFLGVDLDENFGNVYINKGKSDDAFKLSSDASLKFYKHYQETYRYIRDEYPDKYKLWFSEQSKGNPYL